MFLFPLIIIEKTNADYYLFLFFLVFTLNDDLWSVAVPYTYVLSIMFKQSIMSSKKFVVLG